VDTILTSAALKFITALTIQTITRRKSYTKEEFWGRDGNVHHIAPGLAGDLLVIAPVSANTIGKLALGLAIICC